MKVYYEELIEHLRELGDGDIQPQCLREGLCDELITLFDTPYSVIHLAKSWDKYSGDAHYPVPHPSKNSYAAYYGGFYNGCLWGNSEYAENRRELCHHIADEIEEMLNEN